MMSFKDHQKHKHGTYASLNLSAVSSKQLFDHISSLSDKVAKEDYHCTICYSRKPVPEIENLKPTLPIEAQSLNYKIFPTKDGKNVLVLRIKSEEIDSLHKDTMDLGAQYDYADYKAHITIGYADNLPNIPLPDFQLVFDSFNVEGLDPEKKIETK